jgi:hypothetical protein
MLEAQIEHLSASDPDSLAGVRSRVEVDIGWNT